MTEDEAKTKWCFHFIASHTDPRAQQSEYGIERGEPGPFIHNCIGSACMAWRSKPTDEFERRADKAFRHEGVRLTPGPADVDGFCGLAGAPS